MGASGWSYVEPLRGDVPGTLAALRERVFAESDFYWEDEYDEDERTLGARPETLADLDRLRDTEEFWEVGTHSILDMGEMIGPDDEDGDGTVRELSAPETSAVFGTAQPSEQQFRAVTDDSLPMGPRWTGRCVVLYRDDQPAAVAFWGFSGD